MLSHRPGEGRRGGAQHSFCVEGQRATVEVGHPQLPKNSTWAAARARYRLNSVQVAFQPMAGDGPSSASSLNLILLLEDSAQLP